MAPSWWAIIRSRRGPCAVLALVMAVVEVVQTYLVDRMEEMLDLTIHLPDKVLDLVADHQQVIPKAVLVVQQH